MHAVSYAGSRLPTYASNSGKFGKDMSGRRFRCLKGTASKFDAFKSVNARREGLGRTMRTPAPNARGGRLELNFDLTTPELPCGRVTRLRRRRMSSTTSSTVIDDKRTPR